MAAPPDLRVLCRRLTSTPPDELTRLCPVLVSHVLRCGGPLSATQDSKGKDKSSETPVLIHKLKTSITTLLTGRNSSGRFAAICLIKAVIDVGGWECLRAAGPWITGLISVLQKPDPFASKQLCVITLTRIYTLLHGYQTLVREMATPTLPSYVNACIQIIKSASSGKNNMTPLSLVESVVRSLSKIVPLYPTTLRPSTAPIKAAIKVYLAPTMTDQIVVPQSLRQASRHLSVLLHYTAAKDGSSSEWAKAISATIKDCHITADQVFRAVHESWESTTGYRGEAVSTEGEPSGGGDETDDLPSWIGVGAGSQRLVGLIDQLAEYVTSPTKASVTLPIGELLDLTSRLTLVILPGNSEENMNLNAAIGKEEKAELWSSLPEIHTAVMRLHIAMVHSLKENALPLSTDLIDQMARVFTSSRHLAPVRETTYQLAKEILLISGPSLPKLTVKSLVPVIQTCCEDVLRASGHLEDKPSQPTTTTTTNGKKQPQQKPSSTNADDYLNNSSSSPTISTLSSNHISAATTILPLFLSHLPQKHLSPDARGLADRTAILSSNKTAMLASCLYPYKDSRGRYYPSILPFLIRQFPRDQEVEILRTNLLRAGRYVLAAGQDGWDPREGLDELLQEPAETGDNDVVGDDEAVNEDEAANETTNGTEMEIDSTTPKASKPKATNAFFVSSTAQQQVDEPLEDAGRPLITPMKRKAPASNVVENGKKKRVEAVQEQENRQEVQVTIMPKVSAEPQVAVDSRAKDGANEGDDSDSGSDGSVEIDMTMEDDDDDEEDEEEE
ncbi:Pre-rRNA-processing protein rix1 [Naviculisporaceae sp. PSN 640]